MAQFSSTSENRELPITEVKWDARTLTDIPGNTAYWFFAFFWLTEGSRNKKVCIIMYDLVMQRMVKDYVKFTLN
jgi:hypothetical protein